MVVLPSEGCLLLSAAMHSSGSYFTICSSLDTWTVCIYYSLCPRAKRLFTDTSYSRTHSLIKMESMCSMLAVKKRRRTGYPRFVRSPPESVTSTLRSMDTLQSKSHPLWDVSTYMYVWGTYSHLCTCLCCV